MKTFKTFFSPDKAATFILYFSILVFIIAFNFSDNPKSGWYQQFLPTSLPGITDITFTDSLTGYAVTTVDAGSSSYIIKTTNGGDNWNIIFRDSSGREFTKIKFININIGFACTKWSAGTAKLLKTTNGGDFWFALNNPASEPSYLDLCVLSEEELWTVDNIAFDGGVFRTTNGGVNWQRKYYDVSNPPDRIYMINSRIGFIADGMLPNGFLRKTTNGGNDWYLIGDYGFYKMQFEDSLHGYKSDGSLKKTSDGGVIWKTISPIQPGNPPLVIRDFEELNNIIWGVNPSGNILYPNNQYRGIIYRSSNIGMNWGYQLPDTSIHLSHYSFINFSDLNFGWSYVPTVGGVHTVSRGDTVTYPLTSIINHNINLPDVSKLIQNYPNPFNPRTKIEYELQLSGNVIIKVIDLRGNEIVTLINKRHSTGKYNIEFDGSSLPSGVYFYCLLVDNVQIDTKKMLLIK